VLFLLIQALPQTFRPSTLDLVASDGTKTVTKVTKSLPRSSHNNED